MSRHKYGLLHVDWVARALHTHHQTGYSPPLDTFSCRAVHSSHRELGDGSNWSWLLSQMRWVRDRDCGSPGSPESKKSEKSPKSSKIYFFSKHFKIVTRVTLDLLPGLARLLAGPVKYLSASRSLHRALSRGTPWLSGSLMQIEQKNPENDRNL